MIDGIEREIELLQSRISKLISIEQSLETNPELFEPLVSHAIRVFGDSAWSWLCRPSLRLKSRSPLEAVLDGDIEIAAKLLSQFEYGAYI